MEATMPNFLSSLKEKFFSSTEDLVYGVKTIEIDGNKITGNFCYSKKNQIPYGIIYCHGAFDFVPDAIQYKDLTRYALEGYICFGIKYEVEGIENCNLMMDTKEVCDAARWMKKQFPKMKAIYLIGVSRGGFVAYHTMIQYGDWFGGCIVCVGPTNLPVLEKTTVLQKDILDKTMKYFAFSGGDKELSSPTYYAEALSKKPLFLVYGELDNTVPDHIRSPLEERQGEYLWTFIRRYANINPKSDYIRLLKDHGLAHDEETQNYILTWLYKMRIK